MFAIIGKELTPKFCFLYKANLNEFTSIPLEITMAFWYFNANRSQLIHLFSTKKLLKILNIQFFLLLIHDF